MTILKKMWLNFIKTQAVGLKTAWEQEPTAKDFKAWSAYSRWVNKRWKDKYHLTQQIEYSVSQDCAQQQLEAAIATKTIPVILKVWSHDNFTVEHPMRNIFIPPYPSYMISRALHDMEVHINGGYQQTFIEELLGAIKVTYPKLSNVAHAAAWTDDIAVACFREYFDFWPNVQVPIVVKPEWKQLREIID